MEDADGTLFISEESIPTIRWNIKKLTTMKVNNKRFLKEIHYERYG
jgi:hypothetical protein